MTEPEHPSQWADDYVAPVGATWPDRPTCHSGPSVSRLYPVRDVMVWNPPRIDLEMGDVPTFRTCGYCGSMHPADLLAALLAGTATLHGANWKYGWPHKFYVEGMPNKFEGDTCIRGWSYKNGVNTPIPSKPQPTIHAKFYNEHLDDDGFGTAELLALKDAIEKASGVRFFHQLVDGLLKLRYAAPHHGYQRG